MFSAALMLGSTKAFLTPPPQQLRTVRRANSLVDDLLRAVDGTDGGVTATAEQKAAILKQIEQLEASYDRAPFDDAENLYRDGTVAYVGQASSKAANAAGGRFRGRIGRTIFRTRGLFQHLIAPDRAVNCVTFRLFGLVDGAAVLTGKVTRAAKLPPRREAQVRDPRLVEDAERLEVGSSGAQSELTQALAATGEPGPASRSACLVEFARPRIALGTAVFELGPESSVALDTTYLDERVRVIRGGVSDIPFVITRVAAADATAADEWRRIAACERVIKPKGLLALAVGAAALVGGACRRPVVGLPLLVLGLAVAASSGGIVVDDEGRSAGDEKLLADAAWNR